MSKTALAFVAVALAPIIAARGQAQSWEDLVDQAEHAKVLGHTLETKQLLLAAWRQSDSIGKDDPSRARLEFLLGSIYQELGDSRMALPLLEDARRIWEKLGIEDVYSLDNLNHLGQALFELQRPAEAERLLQYTLQTSRRVLGGSHPTIGAVLDTLGNIYFVRGGIAEAEQALTGAVEILRGDGRANRTLAGSLRVLAQVRLLQGQVGAARKLLVEAEVLTRNLGEKSLFYAASLSALGSFYLWEGDAARAQPLLKKALRIFETEAGPTYPDLATVWGGLAEVAFRDGKFLLAMKYLDQSRDLVRKTYGAESQQFAYIDEVMGRALMHQGKLDQAQTSVERANGVLRRNYGEVHYRVAYNYFLLGHVYARQNRREDADRAYQHAIGLLEKTLGDGHVKVAEALQVYAGFLRKTDRKQARMVEQRSRAVLNSTRSAFEKQ